MNVKNQVAFYNMLASKGNFEIIKSLVKSNKPLQFKDFKILNNTKRDGKFSTRTISASIKELESLNLIKNVIIKNNNKKLVGYEITKKGELTYIILKETQNKIKLLEKDF